ncbi:SAGA complex subunit Sgf73 [Marasmius crinis-equi]|uniref:SAGA complex subunit Sgf73 n=1 Tax=Marasmius crinis-equi TaxID=585013 RepID=A0ABR3ERD3_9AGAR
MPQPIFPQRSSSLASDPSFPSTPPSLIAISLGVDCDTDDDGPSDTDPDDEELSSGQGEDDFGGQQVDYKKCCGVINARFFTLQVPSNAKPHSMGAKRTVENRYHADELLLD